MGTPETASFADCARSLAAMVLRGNARPQRQDNPPAKTPVSPLNCIGLFCLTQCCAGHRNDRRNCSDHKCPLWPLRAGMMPETARRKGWVVDPPEEATS